MLLLYVNNDGYCVFRVVRTSLIMLFMTPLFYFWLLWLKLLFKRLWNQGRNPQPIFVVCVYIQKSPHGCFHDVKFLQMGSLKVNTWRRCAYLPADWWLKVNFTFLWTLVVHSFSSSWQLWKFTLITCNDFDGAFGRMSLDIRLYRLFVR